MNKVSAKKSTNLLRKFFLEIKNKKVEYFVLFIILFFTAFFRLFRLDQLLGFWYDQGRDALVIWDLLHYKRFFLIGPVTGIEGIFLGPFYYYLLTPFYFLGQGSPVMAAAGLSWLTVGATFLIYFLGKKIYGKEVGLLSAFLYGFSYSNVVFSRWLANPNPLPFFTMLVLLSFWLFLKEKKSMAIVLASFIIGLCLQLEAASAIFFLPATVVFIVWQRKRIGLKVLFFSFLAFFITLLPQLYFNFRHDGVLFEAFKKFLVADKSFHFGLIQTLKARVLLYYGIFFGKLLPEGNSLRLLCLALFSAAIIFFRKTLFTKEGKLLAIWLLSPIVGFLFYRGNRGYIWDYYFTGAMPAFFILYSAGLYFLLKKNFFGKVVVFLFLAVFSFLNLKNIKNYLVSGIGIKLGAQTRAIDWIYEKAENRPFNADFYVPPQVYYSYSYLMRWYGNGKYGREPETRQVKELYTLYEPDGEHPQFLKSWLERQDTIGKIEDDYSWGDITVQKRERIKYE